MPRPNPRSARLAVLGRDCLTAGLSLVGLVVFFGLVLSACGGGAGPAQVPRPAPHAKSAVGRPPGGGGLVGSRAHVLGRFPEGTFGPRLRLARGDGHAVWATAEAAEVSFFARSVVQGRPQDELERLMAVGPGLRFFELGSMNDGMTALLTIVGDEAGESLGASVVSRVGQLLSGPHLAERVEGRILWVETFPTPAGATLVWATERERGGAHLMSVALTAEGLAGVPRQLSQGARAWQLEPTPSGAVLAITREQGRGQSVELLRLGPDGAPLGASVSIDAPAFGALDLDVATDADGIVVAYGVETDAGTNIRTARLDAQGKVVVGAAAMTSPRGEQFLVRLVSREQGVVAVWEEPQHARSGARELFVSPLDQAAKSGGPALILRARGEDPLLPAFAASGERLVTLSLSDACDGPAPCGTLGRFWTEAFAGATGPRSAELWFPAQSPGSASEPTRPTMSWDLSCDAERCFALLAGSGTAPHVLLAELSPSSLRPLPAVARAPSPKVRLRRAESLGAVEELADLVGAPSGGGELLSWVTFFDPSRPYVAPSRPAPDGRLAPVRALLHTQFVSSRAGGEVAGVADHVISYRARTLGGVSLSEPQGDQRLLAWAALDGTEPQVFATLLDEKGHKLRQKMLTRAPGEITDVSAVAALGGFVIAWVDGRSGSPEVFVAFVDRELRLREPERRLLKGPRSPTGLALRGEGPCIRLLLSDAARVGGAGDVLSTCFDPETFTLTAPLSPVWPTERHSHSPQFLSSTGGEGSSGWFGFIEQDGHDSSPRSSRLLLGELAGPGAARGPMGLDFDGVVQSFGGTCREGSCRLAVVVAARGGAELWGLVFPENRGFEEEAPQPVFLARASEGAAQTAKPVIIGDHVFFETRRSDGRRQLMRVTVDF